MGLHKPHLPFVFPQSYLNLYPASVPLAFDTSPTVGLHNVAWSNYVELRGYTDIKNLNLNIGQGDWMPNATAIALRRAYWAATSFIDAQIGRVLAELRTLGLDKNTTVVLMSDHGWHLGDMGEWAKGTTFEPANRAVLMIRDPSRPTSAGTKIDTSVELLDVYPTLADIADYTAPAVLQGKSLTPLLNGGSATPPSTWKDASFSQILISTNRYATDPAMGYTVRTSDWRYTEWVRYNTSAGVADWNSLVARELFDHRLDQKTAFGSSERVNLAEAQQLVSTRMQLSTVLRTQTALELSSEPTSVSAPLTSQPSSGSSASSRSGTSAPRSTPSSADRVATHSLLVLSLAGLLCHLL
eukprot:scpid85042/ scgid24298/ Iduronate 2-sulfatase; Alpha-L-iduronate sulfate sulfatase